MALLSCERKMIVDFSGEYRFLSNFWSVFVTYEGDSYPSVENAYQAAKMRDHADRKRFTTIKSSEAKKLGKTLPMRDDWDKIKDTIMHSLVRQKFFSNKDLASRLLLTGDLEIQEGNWWGDTYWGTVNGIGQNKLGKTLMAVRTELKLIGG